jgi:predicted TIM-barrel fold metal-dependent hydrolase
MSTIMTGSADVAGAIDCDVHPQVPNLQAIVPYLDDYWQEMVEVRGIDSLETQSYPPTAPLVARNDWRGANGRAAESLEPLQRQLFDDWGVGKAILNCLYGVQILHDPAMAAAMAKGVNEWLKAEWLDREPRLKASIVIAPIEPELAVEEIERLASDHRFIQVLMLVMGEMPLGRRAYWPIYAAAERHGLPIRRHSAGRPPGSRTMSIRPRPSRPNSRAWSATVCWASFRTYASYSASRVSLGCRASFGGSPRTGGACGWRFPGSSGRRSKSCASRSD